MPAVLLRIESDATPAVRVSDVVVEIYDLSGVFQTSGTTDVDGEIQFTLPAASYDLLFYKAGVSILPRQPQRIVVSDTLPNDFLVSCHVRVQPESTDPMLCTVSGYIRGVDFKTAKTRLVLSPVKSLVVIGESILAPEDRREIASDENGYFEFELVRGLEYYIYFAHLETYLGTTPFKVRAVVPDLPAIGLEHLLFPIPVQCVFAENTKSLTVGGERGEIDCTITQSDGSVRGLGTEWAGVKVTNTDNTVVEAAFDGTTLILIPLSPGTVTITTERVLSSAVLWDNPPAYVTESVEVTVA